MSEAMLHALAESFRAAWNQANHEGLDGSRVLLGLDAVLPTALLAYSEWLDGQGLIVEPDAHPDNDDRPHSELVNDFLKEG